MLNTATLVAMVVLVAVAAGVVLIARRHDQRERDGRRRTYRLDFPPGVTVNQVVAFLEEAKDLLVDSVS